MGKIEQPYSIFTEEIRYFAMALYRYNFIYRYKSGDSYQGYVYAEEGSYTVREFIQDDGGEYRITSSSPVDGNDDATTGEVYISDYYDQDISNAHYIPDNFKSGLAAGTEGLGKESDFLSGTEFGHVTKDDGTIQVISINIENFGMIHVDPASAEAPPIDNSDWLFDTSEVKMR